MSDEPEDVLGKADALMRRHRSFVAGNSDDVPVLTDEIALDKEASASLDDVTVQHRVRELLNRMEPEIARMVETWLAAELPGIVARELGALGPRILQATNESLHDALLPEIARLLRETEERNRLAGEP